MNDRPATLRDMLLRRAASDGDSLAYADPGRRVTFGELVDRASARAARLADLGVGPRDRVALVLGSDVAYTEVLWALQLLGAVPCTLNPAVPPETLSRRIAGVRPRLVVTPDLLGEEPPRAEVPPDPGIGPDDLAFLQTTSGTSGEPRAAMVRHRNVIACLDPNPGSVTPDDVMVSWVPPWHDLGLVGYVLGPAAYGAPCHLVPPAVRTIPLWFETIGRVGGTVTGAPDFGYRMATRMVDPAAVDLRTLRHATTGAEPVRRSTVEAFEARFGLPRVSAPGYGLAENTLGATGHPAGQPLVVDERGNVGNGRPLPGVEVRIDGDAASPGEILLRGEYVFAGYLDAPEETREVLRDGWLHTGDVGYADEEGNVFVLGRRRAMIKRAGAVVAPRELEDAALDVDGVRLAAAVGLREGDAVAETVVLVVEAGSDTDAGALEGAVARAVTAAAGFAPGRVVVAPPRTIPRTPNGKVRHADLKDRLLRDPRARPSPAGTA